MYVALKKETTEKIIYCKKKYAETLILLLMWGVCADLSEDKDEKPLCVPEGSV